MSRSRKETSPVSGSTRPQVAPKKLNDLLDKEFAPIRWSIPGILPEGALVLGGKPKMGKSLLALNLAFAVAGMLLALGKILCRPRPVLYLALEDGERRLQERSLTLLIEADRSDLFEYQTEWIDFDQGGLALINAWLVAHPDAGLVVIDTLKKVRPQRRNNQDIYDFDYTYADALHKVALAHHVTILIVHHTRKAVADDFLEELSGSNGLAGAVDGVMILKRPRNSVDAKLHITGRDMDDKVLALRFAYPTWNLLDDVAVQPLTPERRAVLDVFKRADGSLTIKDVTEALARVDPGANPNAVKQRLHQMKEAGLLQSVGRGYYTVTPNANTPLDANQPNHANQPNDANGATDTTQQPPLNTQRDQIHEHSIHPTNRQSDSTNGLVSDVSAVSTVSPVSVVRDDVLNDQLSDAASFIPPRAIPLPADPIITAKLRVADDAVVTRLRAMADAGVLAPMQAEIAKLHDPELQAQWESRLQALAQPQSSPREPQTEAPESPASSAWQQCELEY